MDTLASSLQGINLPPHQSAHSPRRRWKWHAHLHTSGVRNSDLPKAGEVDQWIQSLHGYPIPIPGSSFLLCVNMLCRTNFTPKKPYTKFWQKLYAVARRSRYLKVLFEHPNFEDDKKNSSFWTNHSSHTIKLVKTWMPMEAPKNFTMSTHDFTRHFSHQRVGVNELVFHRGVFWVLELFDTNAGFLGCEKFWSKISYPMISPFQSWRSFTL